PDNQLSLAIGKEGQNARLAAKLTGWRIDIKSESQIKEQEAKKLFADLPVEEEPPVLVQAAAAEAEPAPIAVPADEVRPVEDWPGRSSGRFPRRSPKGCGGRWGVRPHRGPRSCAASCCPVPSRLPAGRLGAGRRCERVGGMP